MSHSILRGLVSSFTGGIVGNGENPSTGDASPGQVTSQNPAWSPTQAEQAFISNTFGNDIGNAMQQYSPNGLANKAMSSLGSLFKGSQGDDSPINSDD